MLYKILRTNHHPFFFFIFVIFFSLGVSFVFISKMDASYIFSLSFMFLFRYLMDIDFLEKLHKEKPMVYMFLFVFGITFVSIFLPKIIIKIIG